jgi:soluble lytic murein transglycosylase-like protein
MQNILRHLCFGLGLGLAAAAGLHGADVADGPQQITRVVRADPRTGRLVRSVIVTRKTAENRKPLETGVAPRPVSPVTQATVASAPAPPPAGIAEAVDRISASHSLPPQLVHSVIKVESNYNPSAVSPKGAQGIMQLMPATARRFGVANVFDPVENIEGGARYLKYLLDLYGGDYRLALAAYNAGEGAVEKYGSVPPYPETRNYLIQVNRQIQKSLADSPARPETRPAEPKAVDPQPSGPARIQEVVGADGTVRYIAR